MWQGVKNGLGWTVTQAIVTAAATVPLVLAEDISSIFVVGPIVELFLIPGVLLVRRYTSKAVQVEDCTNVCIGDAGEPPVPEPPTRKAGGGNEREPPFSERLTRKASTEPRDQPLVYLLVVSKLSSALRVHGAPAVLTKLFDPACRLSLLDTGVLEVVDPASTHFALVSYRQHRAGPGNDGQLSTGPTLDSAALASVVEVAEQAGLRGLWLDAPCYRAGVEYDHVHFCNTLSAVTQCCSEVTWLPRASQRALGDYQFRLWCTFEAAVVEERQLPVRLAGVGLSLSQRMLLALGKRTPWLPGVAHSCDIADLRIANASILLWIVLCWPVAIVYEILLLDLFSTAWGTQVSLASSGQAVLLAMTQGMRHADARARRSLAEPARLTATRAGLAPKAGELLLRNALPWLPAYDRRDSLVVLEALDALTDRRSDKAYVQGVAFSAYFAAQKSPSPGDAVGGKSLCEWLQEKSLLPLLRGRAGDEGPATMPLSVLAALGWIWQRGASHLLRAPVGSLLFPPTGRWEWDLRERRVVADTPRWLKHLTISGGLLLCSLAWWTLCAVTVFYTFHPELQLVDGLSLGWTVLTLSWIVLLVLLCLHCACHQGLQLATGLVPHSELSLRRLSPTGYSIRGIMLMMATVQPLFFVFIYMVGFFPIAVMDNLNPADGCTWPSLLFFNLAYSTVPPGRALLVRGWQLAVVLYNIRAGTEAATIAYHMWSRGGRQTLWPRDEAAARTPVVNVL